MSRHTKQLRAFIADGFVERQKERDQRRKAWNEKYNNARKGKAVKTKGARA